MTGARFSHTRLYTWLLAKYLASYTTCLQHIEYQHITQCRILKKYLTLAHTPTSVKVGDGQRASEFSVRPSEIPLCPLLLLRSAVTDFALYLAGGAVV